MNSQELYQEAAMSYSDLCSYLQRKYGIPEHSYFSTYECKSRSKKNSRGCDGLDCHHIREDLIPLLCNPEVARNCPWEWQEKENLVYCNLLEHLLLHIKIAVYRQKRKLSSPNDVPLFFSTQGVFLICQSINDCYMNKSNLSKRAQAYERKEHFFLLRRFLAGSITNFIRIFVR